MEALGIATFDLVVIGVVLFGGLIGLITGFLRGGLFVLSWIGAIFATMHGFPRAQPFVRAYIEPGYIADIAAGAGLFLVALILLHLLSHLLSGWVRGSRMNALDRTLGLVAGLATAVFFLGAAFLAYSNISAAEERPAFMRNAKTLPLIERAATVVYELAPANLQERFGEAIQNNGLQLQNLDETRRTLELLAAPPPTRDAATPSGYGTGERTQLNRLIEGTR